MKLNSFNRILAMAYAHDFIMIGPGAHRKTVRQGFFFNDERMIARGIKGVREPLEQSFAVMKNSRCFSMHDALCPNHCCAENLTDALMPEANAQYGIHALEAVNQLFGDTGISRACPGRVK